MRGEILSVGTELLLGQILNTNTQYLSQRLAEAGVEVYWHTTVGDNPGRLAGAFRAGFERSDIVIVTGGLGPTGDDLTKETLASVMGRRLVMDEAALAVVRSFFDQRGLTWTENNAKQAAMPEGAIMLANPRGTAPGVWLEVDGHIGVLLPGPPGEMQPMFEESVLPRLLARTGQVLFSRMLRVAGLGESAVETRLKDLMDGSNPTLAPYAKPGEVHLRLTAKARTQQECEALIAPLESEVRSRLGVLIYGTDDMSLSEAILAKLKSRGETLAVAESATGGLVQSRLTDVPGSSDVLLGGAVVYHPSVKTLYADVSQQLIEESGPVSAAVVAALSHGVARRLNADVGLATVGWAGPTADGTVGECFSAVALDGRTDVRHHQFARGRADTRARLTQAALVHLWQLLQG